MEYTFTSQDMNALGMLSRIFIHKKYSHTVQILAREHMPCHVSLHLQNGLLEKTHI